MKKHHFVTCYFNYCGYESRERLTREFVARYPNVFLIEVAYGDKPFVINHTKTKQVRMRDFTGFITNELVNDYIRENRKSIESLTILDSDLDLGKNFFENVEIHQADHISIPTFSQPFSRTRDLHKNSVGKTYSSMCKHFYDTKEYGQECHTGYCHTYNRALLDLIGYLPTSLVLGGFDFLLFLCLLRKKEWLFSVLETIDNDHVSREMLCLYDRLENVNVEYVAGEILHHFHGYKAKRYNNRFELYAGINTEVIKKYFMSREEDESETLGYLPL